MSIDSLITMVAPFVTGFALSLLLFLVAMFASRKLSAYAQSRANAAENSADKNDVNAGRNWATAAQLLPYVIYAIAVYLSVSLLPIDISGLVGIVAASAFGAVMAIQDMLRGMSAKFIIVGSDIYRLGDEVEYNGATLTVAHIGQTHTEFIHHAKDARLIVPNATLVNADIINYDDVVAAKMVSILPSDTVFANDYAIKRFKDVVTKAIKGWSVGDKEASCVLVNVAGDAYEFRLVGFTDSPTEHPTEQPAMYEAAVCAALAAGYSIARTNNNTISSPLSVYLKKESAE